jgi:hypothetical protein
VPAAGRSAARLSTGLAALLLAACAALSPDAPPPAVVPSPPESAEPPLLELRLSHTEPAPGLVPMEHNGETLFVEPEPLVSEADIVHVRAMWDADAPEEILLIVRCTLEASDRVERATSQHLDEPVAILWQSRLRAAPVVRSFVGCERAAMGFDLRDEAEGVEIETLVRERWPGDPPEADLARPLLELRIAHAEPAPELVPMEHDGETLFVHPVPVLTAAQFVHVRAAGDHDVADVQVLVARCTLSADEHLRGATGIYLGERLVVLWAGEIRSVAHVRDEIGCADGIRLEIDAAGEEERRDIMEAVRTRWEEDPDGG